MLNVKISKAAFDKLSEQEQQHYVKDGDDYALDVKGDTPEMARLRQSNSQLNNQLLEANNAKAQAEQVAATADQVAEAKYKEQLATANKSVEQMRESITANRQAALIDGIANKFKQPELFRGVLKDRIIVEYNDKGEVVEKFLDDKGQPCTLEQLTDAYCKNDSYSAMLTAPPTTTTMPTNTPTGVPKQSGNNQHFSGGGATPTFNTPVGGQPQGGTAKWSIDASGKPVAHDYAGMTDAETRAYAEAKLAYTTQQSGAKPN